MTLLDSDSLFAEHAFENGLPIPEVIDATKGRHVTLQVHQITQFSGSMILMDIPSTRQFGATGPG